MTVSRGVPEGAGRRVGVVVARFHEHVTAKLLEGALDGLRARGVADDAVDVAWVPGAFEIPLVARRLASTGAYDALICLGAVVRGETAHFDLVAAEAARGIGDVGRGRPGIPVIFEVLATESLADAEARAGGPHGNKGWDAAETALEMADLLDRLPGGMRTGAEGGEHAMIVEKPWGRVVTYALNQPSSVRVITVEPGQETSVHYHRMRDETWVVLDPGLSIEIGDRIVDAGPGEEFVIPAEQAHRIRCTAPIPGRILEVAYGYTTEDDTQRLQDAYGRPLEPDW